MMADDAPVTATSHSQGGPMATCTVAVAGRSKLRLTLLPPPKDRLDPLAVVDIGRAAEVVLLAVPGGERSEWVDKAGQQALEVLRALGLPEVVLAVQSSTGGTVSGTVSMKDRSAAKKRAEAAVAKVGWGRACVDAGVVGWRQPSMACPRRADPHASAPCSYCPQVLAGEHRAFHTDTAADCAQLVGGDGWAGAGAAGGCKAGLGATRCNTMLDHGTNSPAQAHHPSY